MLWGPGPGQIRELLPLPGDTVGEALAINDHSQVVGASGSCANTIIPGFAGGPHAVFWDADGSRQKLPDFGGTIDPSFLAALNAGFAVNNSGLIAGQLVLPGSSPGKASGIFHAVLWTNDRVPHDLGTLPGDLNSAALAMNNGGAVVGSSIGGNGNPLTDSARVPLAERQ